MWRNANATAWFVLVAVAAAGCGSPASGGNTGGSAGEGGSGGEAGSGGFGGSGGGNTSSSSGDPFAIDECAMNLDDCAPDANCIDTPGYFICECKAGYEGDGKTCSDINECTGLVHDCDSNATCTNTAGGFECSCPAGFSGDGKTCIAEYLSVTAGQYHACAIRRDKTLWCWGLNSSGQAGTGTGDVAFYRPVAVGNASNWSVVSAGAAFTCALDEAKHISCFGTNGGGQLGNGTTTTQTTPSLVIGGMEDWASISAGSTHACAIRENGELYCWGTNNRGQIGVNTTTNVLSPVLVDAGPWKSVDAGTEFTCGVKMDGTLHCWGLNSSRQVGDGTTTNRLVPTQESTLATNWARVSTGNAFACGVKTDGTRHCWGANSLAHTGDGTLTSVTTPKAVDMDTDWSTSMDLGDFHGCAQKTTGALYCWGDGSVGQTGIPENESLAMVPAPVTGNATDWVSFSSGLRFTCGVRQTGALLCWGSGSRGALGLGFTPDRTSPSAVGMDSDWERLSVQLDNGCGIRSGGKLYCWGRNVYGHLGDGTNLTRVTPVAVDPDKVWKRVVVGRTHTCGIASAGGGPDSVYCWGFDNNGEQGNGTGTTNQLLPTAINATAGNDSPWVEIAAGLNHTCAVREDKTLWCWGRNASGQLGDGTLTARSDPKQILPADVQDWVNVVASGDFTCGLREGGVLYCWGVNTNGQLGQGDVVSPVNLPKLVMGTYSTVDASANHVCGVRMDGTLWCWGRNSNGEIGIGNSVSPQSSPVKVGNATDWARPWLGQGVSSCATKTNGDLHCWGSGGFGQLGLGTFTSFNTPQKVPSPAPWKAISLGNEHTCGILQNGTLSCWGAANYGQLGSGVPFLSTPTAVLDPI